MKIAYPTKPKIIMEVRHWCNGKIWHKTFFVWYPPYFGYGLFEYQSSTFDTLEAALKAIARDVFGRTSL